MNASESEYIEIENVVKGPWTQRKILSYCYKHDVKLYTYVLATHFKKDSSSYEKPSTEVVYIDRKYLAIQPAAIDDFIGLNENDSNIAYVQFLTSVDFPRHYLTRLDANRNPAEYQFSHLRLYLHVTDISVFQDSITEEKATLPDAPEKIDIVQEVICTSTNKDARWDPKIQKIADELAAQYAKEHNGKIVTKKGIAILINKKYEGLGSWATLLRRFDQTWKPKKSSRK